MEKDPNIKNLSHLIRMSVGQYISPENLIDCNISNCEEDYFKAMLLFNNLEKKLRKQRKKVTDDSDLSERINEIKRICIMLLLEVAKL